jgi:hypothetical protein
MIENPMKIPEGVFLEERKVRFLREAMQPLKKSAWLDKMLCPTGEEKCVFGVKAGDAAYFSVLKRDHIAHQTEERQRRTAGKTPLR